MEGNKVVSITFYDKDNPARHNDDGDQIGGGVEVNFNEANAYNVLLLMGLCSRVNPDLYGEMSGADFRKCIHLGLANLDMAFNSGKFTISDWELDFYFGLKNRIERLLTVFMDTQTVSWG